MESREYRYTPSEFELRGKVGEGAVLDGYAAIFDAETVIAGMFREQVAASAFKKTLKESDVRALFNHDANRVLGRNKAGTLALENDERGLHYEIDLPDTATAREVYTLVERGDISQSSFAFETVRQEWDEPDDELPLRTLKEVRLFDISPVTYPAYDTTEVQARSILDLAIPQERGITQEPEEEPEQEPRVDGALADHSETTPEPKPPTGIPVVARLALIDRLK